VCARKRARTAQPDVIFLTERRGTVFLTDAIRSREKFQKFSCARRAQFNLFFAAFSLAANGELGMIRVTMRRSR